MARGGDGLIDLLLIGGAGAAVYKFSLDGTLGIAMQDMAAQIAKQVTGQPPEITWKECDAPFGEIVPMIEANSKLAGQILDWQTQRRAEGRTPFDWNGFRRYLTRQGFPDPGNKPPSVFCRNPV